MATSPFPLQNKGVSATPAIHFLRAQKVPFTEHPYRYEERGGTAVSSRELGVDEHIVIKTLVMEDEQKQPLIVLMHGDRDVSTKNLARQSSRKTIAPCAPDAARPAARLLLMISASVATRIDTPPQLNGSRAIAHAFVRPQNRGAQAVGQGLEPGQVARRLSKEKVEVHGGDRRALQGSGGVANQHGIEADFVKPATDLDEEGPRVHAFAQASLSDTVRLKTGRPGALPGSAQK